MARPTFSILKKDTKSHARLGVLRTPHGTVQTPTYVIVATNANIRALKPREIKQTGTQLVISNTYHLWDEKEVHKKLGTNMPMMTDSGGFQVFSFGAAKEHGVGKVLKQPTKRDAPISGVRITEKGVHFTVDGNKRFISAESSIAMQERLGADIIFAFDECTSPLHPFAYQKQSMERTHRWAQRSLKAHTRTDQLLYGIVQGGRFESLRTKSAKVIGAMDFGGFGIGGSFGEASMTESLAWITPYLPEDKPRHLLGIGTVKDIFIAVEAGMDTMDCVIPTREARHGKIYTATGPIDIRKGIYAASKARLDARCGCPACTNGTTRAYLRTLFKAHDHEAGHLATLHNVWWFNNLLKHIRIHLAQGTYFQFKKKFLKKYSTGS